MNNTKTETPLIMPNFLMVVMRPACVCVAKNCRFSRRNQSAKTCLLKDLMKSVVYCKNMQVIWHEMHRAKYLSL